jgi:hypothetical protein
MLLTSAPVRGKFGVQLTPAARSSGPGPSRSGSGWRSKGSIRARSGATLAGKQVGPQPIQGQVANLVQDQQLGLDELLELLVEPVLLMRRVSEAIRPAAVRNAVR